MQSLETPEIGNSTSPTISGSPVIQGHNQQLTSESQLLITSSAVDTALLHAKSVGISALHFTSHQGSQPTILATPTIGIGCQALVYTTIPLAMTPIGYSARPRPTVNQPLPTTPAPPHSIAGSSLTSINKSIEQVVAKRFAEMEALIQKIPGVLAPIRKSSHIATQTHIGFLCSHRDAQEILLPQHENVRWHH